MKTKTEEQFKRKIRTLEREIRELKERIQQLTKRAVDAENDVEWFQDELDKYDK